MVLWPYLFHSTQVFYTMAFPWSLSLFSIILVMLVFLMLKSTPSPFPPRTVSRGSLLFALSFSLCLADCPGSVDSGKWFNLHANDAKTPVIHAANYTNVRTVTCWHHAWSLVFGGGRGGGVRRRRVSQPRYSVSQSQASESLCLALRTVRHGRSPYGSRFNFLALNASASDRDSVLFIWIELTGLRSLVWTWKKCARKFACFTHRKLGFIYASFHFQ